MQKHITEYSGGTFYGFRVAMMKRGLTFTKYFSSTKLGRDEALRCAIECERDLSQKIAENRDNMDKLREIHAQFYS